MTDSDQQVIYYMDFSFGLRIWPIEPVNKQRVVDKKRICLTRQLICIKNVAILYSDIQRQSQWVLVSYSIRFDI